MTQITYGIGQDNIRYPMTKFINMWYMTNRYEAASHFITQLPFEAFLNATWLNEWRYVFDNKAQLSHSFEQGKINHRHGVTFSD